MTHYGLAYKDATEEDTRFKIFKGNVEYVESSQKVVRRLQKLAADQFADLMIEEFKLLQPKPRAETQEETTYTDTSMSYQYQVLIGDKLNNLKRQ